MKSCYKLAAASIALITACSSSDVVAETTKTFAPLVTSGSGLQCTDFSNVAAPETAKASSGSPEIINGCSKYVTATVVNYDHTGKLIATRFFHLAAKMSRPLEVPGLQMFIESEGAWMKGTGDDGSNFITMSHHDLSGSDLWEARNTSADRYNAFQVNIYQGSHKIGFSYNVLAPGQSARMYAFFPGETGSLILDWAILDPK